MKKKPMKNKRKLRKNNRHKQRQKLKMMSSGGGGEGEVAALEVVIPEPVQEAIHKKEPAVDLPFLEASTADVPVVRETGESSTPARRIVHMIHIDTSSSSLAPEESPIHCAPLSKSTQATSTQPKKSPTPPPLQTSPPHQPSPPQPKKSPTPPPLQTFPPRQPSPPHSPPPQGGPPSLPPPPPPGGPPFLPAPPPPGGPPSPPIGPSPPSPGSPPVPPIILPAVDYLAVVPYGYVRPPLAHTRGSPVVAPKVLPTADQPYILAQILALLGQQTVQFGRMMDTKLAHSPS